VSANAIAERLTLEPADKDRLANLCGAFDQHLRQIENRLGIKLNNRGGDFELRGESPNVQAAERVIQQLYAQTLEEELTPGHVHLSLQESSVASLDDHGGNDDEIVIRTKRGAVRARGANQQHYVGDILTHDINFGIGPAGTGKTYLAVACAVDALERGTARRLVLVRPAVEAGEKLGFLPGDLSQKVDPYLRPLYDALFEMMGFEKVGRLIEKAVIEVAPLAFMRGRTLNDSFVILDEAQNTTVEQMKMFLTRIGFGSKAVITGDITQTDLPRHQKSGLGDARRLLQGIEGVSFTHFTGRDVVRHPLVQRIVAAYDESDKERQADRDKAQAERQREDDARAAQENA